MQHQARVRPTLLSAHGHLGAGFVNQRQNGFFFAPRGGRIQFQLFLPAERRDPAAVGFQMTLRSIKCFLRLVQVLTNIFELVLEVIEGLLRLGQLETTLLEAAGDFVPLVHQLRWSARSSAACWERPEKRAAH